MLRGQTRRCLILCDDLSFEREDADYKALKSVLEGGIEGRPDNVLFYATSNRRHLMPRDMIENERATAINPAEATEEKASRGLQHWADPAGQRPGEFNTNDGGRGVYFQDPAGHYLEILTRPYGSGS